MFKLLLHTKLGGILVLVFRYLRKRILKSRKINPFRVLICKFNQNRRFLLVILADSWLSVCYALAACAGGKGTWRRYPFSHKVLLGNNIQLVTIGEGRGETLKSVSVLRNVWAS